LTPWRRPHYVRPYLASQDIEDVRPGHLRLRNGARTLDLSVGGDSAEAAALLTQLTDPCSDTWARADETDAIAELVTALDLTGWILDADVAGGGRREQDLAELREAAGSAADWYSESVRLVGVDLDGDSLAATVLDRCRCRWREGSPLAARVVDDIIEGRGVRPDRWEGNGLELTDVIDIKRQVWAAVQLAAFSGRGGAARAPALVPRDVPSGPGINVLVAAEASAEALLGELGRTGLEAVLDLPSTCDEGARVVFQHRWFQTIRYVDSVASLLHHRLGLEMRELVTRYLVEEAGHEVHEVEACRSLGVDEAELAEFAPLAWFAVHPDVLTDLAVLRPVSFLVSVTVAEGFPHGARRVSEMLHNGGDQDPTLTQHDFLDRDLAHEGVTRTLLGAISWVDADVARQAIADFLLVTELTHAGWQQLANYVAAELPATPRAFAIDPLTSVRIGTRRR
jgi:hypothetical protein